MIGSRLPRPSAATGVRATLFLLCLLLAIGGDTSQTAALAATFSGLVVLAVVQTRPLSSFFFRLATIVEACVWAAGVLSTGADTSPLLPYLLAPAFAGGIAFGLDGVLGPVGAAALAILAGSPAVLSDASFGDIARVAGQWVVLALVVGLLAAWVQRLQNLTPSEESYLQAYRLMAQLRAVARRLPAGLDRLAVGDSLLREVRSTLPQATGGAVLLRSEGSRLSLLVHSGLEPIDGSVDISGDSLYADAWASQRPAVDAELAVLPLVAGDRTRGLLVLTLREGSRIRSDELARAVDTVRAGALRLETALLFDELREVATVEERRRLAREIHDGVAQDLAAFGYELDALAHDVGSTLTHTQVAEQLLRVRRDLGGLVGELRHSIFELRTEVGADTSLGAAVADFAHAVGRATGLSIHLAVEESSTRLAADTEAELLRIAQEAINNSRKHARAQNVWIRCEVAPPNALVVIEDDGVGPLPGREEGFGLQIMRERALRLRAELDIAMRVGGGTIVTCRLGRR